MENKADLYVQIFENSLDAMLVFNDVELLDCNRAAMNMLRCENKSELKHIHPGDISPPVQPDGTPSYEGAQKVIQQVREEGHHRFRWLHRRMDGTDFYVNVTCLKIRWNGQDCTLVTWHDISDQVMKEGLAQQELNNIASHLFEREKNLQAAQNEIRDARQNLEIFHTAFDTTDADIIITDAKGHILYANRSYREHTGYNEEEIIGAKARELKHTRTNSEQYKEMVQIVSTGKSWNGVLQNQRKNGEVYWVRTRISPMVGEDNRISHYIAVESDISELIVQKEKAEQASQAKTLFLSNMSHELRTPLNAINGFSELLQKTIRHISDPKIRENAKLQIQTIIMSGNHLLNMIDDILNLAQLESGKLNLTVQPVYLEDIMTEVMTLAKALPGKYGRDVKITLIKENLDQYLRGDPSRFRQILINLISNAIKYNHDGGRVEIAVEKSKDSMTQITIRDTGKGIPKEVQGRIFTPFDRLGEEGSGIEGTGVGLALTRNLVELLNAQMGFSSEVGVGSEFWVRLPATLSNPQLALAAERPHKQRAEPACILDLAHSTKTILLVEDNPYYIQIIENFLFNNPNIVLISAIDAKSALAIAKLYPPDIVMIDSDVAGLQISSICDQMANLPNGNHVTIALISSLLDKNNDCQTCATNCPVILKKPLDFEQLRLFLVDTFQLQSSIDKTKIVLQA